MKARYSHHKYTWTNWFGTVRHDWAFSGVPGGLNFHVSITPEYLFSDCCTKRIDLSTQTGVEPPFAKNKTLMSTNQSTRTPAMTVPQKPVTALARRPKALEIMGEALMIDPPTLLSILQNQIMPNASNDEVAAFVIVCNVHGLNPILREIYAFPDPKRKRIVPVVGVDGWAKIVNRQEDYDGCDFEWQFGQDGSPVACTCKLYHKRRSKPIVVTEYFEECKRNTDPWQGMPNRMLRHKAFIQAVRLAFGVAGIFDEDEARDIIRDQSQSFMGTPGLLVTQQPKSESVSVDGSESSVEAELAPATPPGEAKPEPDNRTPQQIVRAQLEAAGVDFETFRNYLVKQGIDKDGDSYANWDEVKTSTLEALGEKGVAKILRIYGSKGVAK